MKKDVAHALKVRLLCLLALTCITSIVFAQAKKAVTSGKELPNIIFILADDLGYGDLGCYGQQRIKTPHIDALAKEGMRFTNFYGGSPVCAPSRASLMTGQHTGHLTVRGNGEIPLNATDTILPQILRQKGYTNGMVGKWGLGLQETEAVPEKKGWDFFAGHLHHLEGHFQKPDSAWQMIDGFTRKVKLPQGIYANEWFNGAALQFIRENQHHPFFLYVSYTLPHARTGPGNGLHIYHRGPSPGFAESTHLELPQQYLQPYLNADGTSKFSPETAHPMGMHYGPQPFPRAAYAGMVTQMDDYVGNIMALLKKLKLEENTLVIFTSDNGTHIEGGRTLHDVTRFFKSSGPLRGLKRDLYEGGIRIPFIAHWKGHIPANKISNFTGSFWDILPTFSSLVKTNHPGAIDGISFLPTLLHHQQAARTHPLYWEFYENGFKQAVRNNNWKAIRFYKGNKPLRTELYNLAEDKGEQIDLSVKYPARVKELEQVMDKEHRASSNPLFQVK